MSTLTLTADQVLTTTRSVRKRLDFDRPVPPELIEECLEIAIQAPSGSNRQDWAFVVLTDPAQKKVAGDAYRRGFEVYAREVVPRLPAFAPDDPRTEQIPRVVDSAMYLAQRMHEAPVLVIPCIRGKLEGAPIEHQAASWGSILPATWSFMLALRARGLGSAWTTVHLVFAAEVARAVGIPDDWTQAALLPVAYTLGTDFNPARRLPAASCTWWNRWGTGRGQG